MGTRSLTHIYETPASEAPFVTIYRQYDGYPGKGGIACDIKAILGSKKLVNGYSDPENQCNGMGCAAAMLVGGLKKDKCGNVYIYPANDKNDADQDYSYKLYPDGDGFRFVVMDGDSKLYDGLLNEYDAVKLEEAQEA